MMSILLGASTVPVSDPLARVRAFTRSMEFDYVSWTAQAAGVKLSQFALGIADYLPTQDRSGTVLQALDLVHQINQLKSNLNDIYADPSIDDPKAASAEIRQQLNNLQSQKRLLEPVAESILQDQVGTIATEYGLTFVGQTLPPVLFHITPPPDALVISPRNVIRQDHNISISPDITVDQMDDLENQVDKSLDVSSLVVGIGGIGLYPTMVEETTDINALVEVVAHEWVHNYLTLRPLGISYENSPELRTMNETVASIAGKELGRAIVKKYYPEYLPPEDPTPSSNPDQNRPPRPADFNFNAEMHTTRVNTDRLLSEGKVDAAETYMELRREFLWDHGYHIRKLNQAYFAFYGAYADQPGGAAGADPVGTAVRFLRAESSSLEDFINRIAWMWNFDQLRRAIANQ
ncbi:MAG TPA: hypothetical protein VLD65_02185 [Anaerolineales bacterium]|nr:hypothetical protein [Anaerolineales bacterium]